MFSKICHKQEKIQISKQDLSLSFFVSFINRGFYINIYLIFQIFSFNSVCSCSRQKDAGLLFFRAEKPKPRCCLCFCYL